MNYPLWNLPGTLKMLLLKNKHWLLPWTHKVTKGGRPGQRLSLHLVFSFGSDFCLTQPTKLSYPFSDYFQDLSWGIGGWDWYRDKPWWGYLAVCTSYPRPLLPLFKPEDPICILKMVLDHWTTNLFLPVSALIISCSLLFIIACLIAVLGWLA